MTEASVPVSVVGVLMGAVDVPIVIGPTPGPGRGGLVVKVEPGELAVVGDDTPDIGEGRPVVVETMPGDGLDTSPVLTPVARLVSVLSLLEVVLSDTAVSELVTDEKIGEVISEVLDSDEITTVLEDGETTVLEITTVTELDGVDTTEVTDDVVSTLEMTKDELELDTAGVDTTVVDEATELVVVWPLKPESALDTADATMLPISAVLVTDVDVVAGTATMSDARNVWTEVREGAPDQTMSCEAAAAVVSRLCSWFM